MSEADELAQQLAVARAERAAFLQQRDEAIGERNDAFAQRDAAVAKLDAARARLARLEHRALVATKPAACTPERILLHIHLAKTGGVTLNNIFVRNLEPEEYLNVDMSPQDESALGTWSYQRVQAALERMSANRLRAVWGHYRPDISALLPRRCTTITILRDPVDRIVSEFYYRKIGSDDDPPATLRDYAFRKRPYDLRLDNYLTRILSHRAELDPSRRDANTGNSRLVGDADFQAAAKTLADFSVVGVLDRFEETLLVIGHVLRWSLSDLVYTHDNRTEDRPHIDDIEPDVHERIAEWNRYDAELVEQARTHLMMRTSVYPGDFGRDLAIFRKLNAMYQTGASIEQIREVERSEPSDKVYKPTGSFWPLLPFVNPAFTSTHYPEN
jgi:hypothetical protein